MSSTQQSGALKMSANRLSMLSTPKHRKKYKGGMSFASAELAKIRSQNLLETAANVTSDKNKAGGGATNDSSECKADGNVVSASVDQSSRSGVKTSKNIGPPPRSLSVAAKKLWKMPEHFVKLLKPEENPDVTDATELEAPPKQTFADNMKKNVSHQSRLYGGGAVGRKHIVKNSLDILSMSKIQSKTKANSTPQTKASETEAVTRTQDSTNKPNVTATSISTNTQGTSHVTMGAKAERSTAGTGRYMTSTRSSASPSRNARESRNAVINAAAASYTKNNARLSNTSATVSGPPSSHMPTQSSNKNPPAVTEGATASTSGTTTRVINKANRDRIVANAIGKSVPVSSPSQITPKPKDKDNVFSRFTSTGKTRNFGNATMASKQKAEPVVANTVKKNTTTRSNFSAAKPTARVTAAKGSPGPTESTPPLMKSSSLPITAVSASVKNESSIRSTTRNQVVSSNSEPMSASGGATTPVKQKSASEPSTSTTIVARGGASTPTARASMRELMRASSAPVGSTKQEPPSGSSDVSIDVNKNKTRTGVSNTSPRFASSTQSTRGEVTRISPRNDATKTSKVTASQPQRSREIATEGASAQLVTKTPENLKESLPIETTDTTAESKQEDNSEGNSTFQSLASYQPDTTYANASKSSGEARKVIKLRRCSFEVSSLPGGDSPDETPVLTPMNLSPPLTPTSTERPSTGMEDEDDVAASAAAIELRNARRRFRLSRDAAAAAVESRKANRRREFSFVASSNPKNSEAKSDPPGSPVHRANSPIRRSSKPDVTPTDSTLASPTASPTKRQDSPVSDRVGVVNGYAQDSAPTPVKTPKKRVRFSDEFMGEEKVNYASLTKPKVVIRSKPPLNPTRFGTPPPRTVEEALLFSKLRAENLKDHEEMMKDSSSQGYGDATATTTPRDSARSDLTVSLSKEDDRDEYLTFEKESFVF